MYRDSRLSKPDVFAPTAFAQRKARFGLRHLVYVAIFTLLAAGIVATAYLLTTMTERADVIALRHEKALVHEALLNQATLLARDQRFPAVNDETIRQVHGGAIDPAFAQALAGQMWGDYDHDWTMIIGPADDVMMVAVEDEIVAPAAGAEVLGIARDLVETARAGYFAERRPTAGGYRIKYVEKGELAPIFASDVREIGDRPALVSATAIIPETDAARHPEGPPGVLVSVRFLEEKLVAGIGATFLLKGFHYAPDEISGAANVPVDVGAAQPIGYFEWASSAPGTAIRAAVEPIAAGLMLALIVLGTIAARRLAAKSRALEESEARNRHLALHDSLTGLVNRLCFGDALDAAMATCRKHPCAVLAIDLDRFKAVNDTYGHDAGDLVIREVAARLLTLVGESGLVARVGGDEFLALITGNVEESRMRWLCDAIVEDVARPIPVGAGIARIGASIGWAIAPRNADNASLVLRMADQSLYNAKESGRNVAVFIEDLYDADTPPSIRKTA
ncbi:diguanylate cyclase [Breoghania sp. L-A4]|uniref:diguanylate cyclase domain-containing protein n=1 Tax=Breoghania sp. L-A4 TaxID=2304600 RepID=UPI000E358BD5|nr:diguanylate cyclase [Breoghania sp. L-A4]AXS42079.1 diguanylate cyclase [Breoghania sp. L-A4]